MLAGTEMPFSQWIERDSTSKETWKNRKYKRNVPYSHKLFLVINKAQVETNLMAHLKLHV